MKRCTSIAKKLSDEEKQRRALNRRRKAALAAEAEALRHAAKRREWTANGSYLTWTELIGGVDCRGCGLPLIDDLGSWPPLLKMTDEVRTAYEADRADFKRRHPDCHAVRWSMSGSRTDHCGLCCPPPPLSERQKEAIRRIFSTNSATPADLVRWRLTLTCDHMIERSQHRSNNNLTSSTALFSECNQIRGIVTTEPLTQIVEGLSVARQDLTQADLDKARGDYERLQKKADAARRRLEELTAKRERLHRAQD